MALNLPLSPALFSSSPSHSPSLQKSPVCFSLNRAGTEPCSRRRISNGGGSSRGADRRSGPVRSSLDSTAGTCVGTVTEVDKDTFWPLVEAAGSKVVVLDMYTQWCGPCKVMAPKYQALSEKYLDVVFMKLDCNNENRPLAKELGIRVVPTFKILKDSKVVKEVTGAKFDDLVFAIDTVKSSS